MSTKRDPLATLINYFTTADIGQATQALTVVKEIVRSRQPAPVVTGQTAGKRKAAGNGKPKPRPGLPTRPAAPTTAVAPGPSVPPPPGTPREGFPSL